MSAILALGAIIAAGVVGTAGPGKKSSPAGSGQSAVGVQDASAKAEARTAMELPSSWKLTFDSNFTGRTLNTKVWATCYWWANGGCTNYGNKSEEEWYLPSQAVVSGGVLHLVAERKATKGTNAKGNPETYSCRSGMVTTFKGFRFKYGFVSVTARLPFGTGLWPAFWLLAADEKWPPEIDILEHWGNQTVSDVNLHPLNGPRHYAVYHAVYKAPTADRGWHTWGLYWTKTRLTWYYDGIKVYTTAKGIPQQAMYFIANLADTKWAVANTDIPGGACNGTLLVKSVRVWEP